MALRQYRPEEYQYEEQLPKEKQASYQAYKPQKRHENRLKDLLFFVNIAIFSIMTVMATYVYLSMNFPSFLAMILGMATGFISLRVIQIAMRNYYAKLKRKKSGR